MGLIRDELIHHLRDSHNHEFVDEPTMHQLRRAHQDYGTHDHIDRPKVWAENGRVFFVVNNREFEVVVPPTIARAYRNNETDAARATAGALAEAFGVGVTV